MEAKTEVYSWRLSRATKVRLEDLARRRRRSVAQLLEEIVAEELDTSQDSDAADLDHQRELHHKAAKFAGGIVGHDPRRSEKVRSLVRARLERGARAR